MYNTNGDDIAYANLSLAEERISSKGYKIKNPDKQKLSGFLEDLGDDLLSQRLNQYHQPW